MQIIPELWGAIMRQPIGGVQEKTFPLINEIKYVRKCFQGNCFRASMKTLIY